MCVGLSGEIERWEGLFGRFEWETGGAEWGVGHVSGCGGLGIEPRKVRDGASKGQGWRGETWLSWGGMGRVGYRMGALDGKRLNVRWLHKCARMAYLDVGRGAVGKTV